MNLDSGGVITLCIFMVVHLCGTVWWMSKVNATLGFIGQQMNDIMKTVASHEATYAKKEDVTKDCVMMQRQIDAIWRKIDKTMATPEA
jgi:hypothetical protein